MLKPQKQKEILFFNSELEMKIKEFILTRDIKSLKKYINSFAGKFSLNHVYYHSAKLLTRYGFLEDAEAFYRKILLNDPNDKFIISSLGVLLSAQDGREDEALEYLLKAVQLNPNQRELHRIIGYIYSHQGKLFHAEEYLLKEIDLLEKENLPICDEMISKYATACSQIGKHAEAMEYHLKALEVYPNTIEFYGEMIFTAAHAPGFDDIYINNIAKRCTETAIYRHEIHQKCKDAIAKITSKNDYKASRKIKLGIISSSMHSFNAERFVSDIIEYLDFDKIELYCYYTGERIDILSKKFEALSHKFHQLEHDEFYNIAKTIAEDGVHILFDTVGYLKGQNLNVLSFKPAPIQFMGYGFWGSTGLKEMDYVLLPIGAGNKEIRDSYTEDIVELSAFYYNCIFKGVEILPSPYNKKGYITFGCQNRRQKLNDEVLGLWARMLHEIPNSKLLLTINANDPERYIERVMLFFSEMGINNSRIINLTGYTGLSYLEIYNQIDVVLDPFPFSGGCTSFDALNMGKPILTLHGPRMTQNTTSEFLKDAELEELIAYSEGEYIEKAKWLAENPEIIDNYNKTIPGKWAKSKTASAKYCGEELQEKIEWMFKQKFETLPWEN